MLPLILALLLQTTDAGYACHRLGRGAREWNPLLGQSCGRLVGIKTALLAGGAILPLPVRGRRLVLMGLAVGGGVGLGVSVTLARRDP